jgi:transcriptional regulator with XRE-family HTH domain
MADEPWQRLAELVRLRREELHLSQRQVGVTAGTTDRLISDIERAARENYEPATLRAVARALGWTAYSIRDILTDGNPTLSDGTPESTTERLDRLEQEVTDMKAGIFARLERALDEVERLKLGGRPPTTEPNDTGLPAESS